MEDIPSPEASSELMPNIQQDIAANQDTRPGVAETLFSTILYIVKHPQMLLGLKLQSATSWCKVVTTWGIIFADKDISVACNNFVTLALKELTSQLIAFFHLELACSRYNFLLLVMEINCTLYLLGLSLSNVSNCVKIKTIQRKKN